MEDSRKRIPRNMMVVEVDLAGIMAVWYVRVNGVYLAYIVYTWYNREGLE